ncbi:MAG: hypothetical protein HYR55_12295 [Acidobacteria bacterium]|nr:hypothetical protein [Acidobacteriota bacterium]MBI3655241.1 hypothetical protein [Acidobacteriota bacterium]
MAVTLVKAGAHGILPLDVEEVRNGDGSEKQDSEINAGQRLIQLFSASVAAPLSGNSREAFTAP